MKNNRNYNFDNISIFKAISVFLVVFIHISATPVVESNNRFFFIIFDILNQFSACAVPMFIFASGFLLFYKYQKTKLNYGNFLKRRFSKILFPYLAWATLYFFINLKINGELHLLVTGNLITLTLLITSYIKGLILGTHMYHLYFVAIIMQFYLLFPFILWTTKKYSYKIVLPLALIITFALSSYRPLYADRIFLTYFIFFFMGTYASKHFKSFENAIIKAKFTLSTLYIAISTINCYYMYQIYQLHETPALIITKSKFVITGIIGILFYYFVSMTIQKANTITSKKPQKRTIKSLLLKINSGSYYIYLSHPLALLMVEFIFRRQAHIGIIYKSALSFIAVILIVMPLSILYAKRKTIRKIKSEDS